MSLSGRIRRHTWRRVLTGPAVLLLGAATAAGAAGAVLLDSLLLQTFSFAAAATAFGLAFVAAFGRYVSQRKRFHGEALNAAKRDLRGDGQTRLAVLREYLMLTGDRVLTKEADTLLHIDGRLEKLKQPGGPADADPTTLSSLIQLRDAAVQLLIKTAQLKDHADQVVLPEAKQRLEQLRQDLLDSARQSAKRLNQTLDHLQLRTLTQDARRADQTAGLKADLDQQLELARRIDHRLEQFDQEIQARPDTLRDPAG